MSDICKNKHQGNQESKAANPSDSAKTISQQKIMIYIEERIRRGALGFTAKEIAQVFDVQLNTISGRFSELKKLGLLVDTGDRRDRSAVLTINRA